jgi:hypothetical protein
VGQSPARALATRQAMECTSIRHGDDPPSSSAGAMPVLKPAWMPLPSHRLGDHRRPSHGARAVGLFLFGAGLGAGLRLGLVRHLGLGRPASARAAQTDLLGERRAARGIVRRHHRVIGRQSPFLAVLSGGQPIGGLEMPLEHLHLLPVFERDQVVGRDRLPDRNRRFLADLWHDSRGGRSERRQRAINLPDERRQVVHRDGIVGHMRRDDFGRYAEQVVGCQIIRHASYPLRRSPTRLGICGN